MTSFRGKFRVVASLAALFLLAGAISCKGFFVNPTLTGLTVTCPSCSSSTAPNLTGLNSTAQLLATGNYDDGSSKTLTSSVDWSSADSTQVDVDNTTNKGRITAKVTSTTTSVTITASNGTISGSVPVTIGQAATTVTCTSCTNGNTVSLTAGTVSFTASTASNWSSNSAALTITQTNSTTATGTLVNTGTATVTATPTGSGAAGSITITITQ